MIHTLKTDPAVFQAVASGAKTYEIRKNDRKFQVGDDLLLCETVHSLAAMLHGAPLEFSGNELTKTISHVLGGYGLQDGWVILSFAPALAAIGAKAPAAQGTQMMDEDISMVDGCMIGALVEPEDASAWQRIRAALATAGKPAECVLSPVGWYCTRKAGHDGPCAAHPIASAQSARVDWMMCESISEEPSVDDALRIFSEDPTQDNATGAIQAALQTYLSDSYRQMSSAQERPAKP